MRRNAARANMRRKTGDRSDIPRFLPCGYVADWADSEARASYEKALALARQEPHRRFLARRLEELNEKIPLASIFAVRYDHRMNDPAQGLKL
jgi:hypothetical protein